MNNGGPRTDREVGDAIRGGAAGPASPAPGSPGDGSAARVGVLALAALMYLVVSGGAYGIEDAVRIAGARLTLLLCLVVPLALSLPSALMATELTALMPLEGGFYFWVKEALGPFAGFAEAYLTILYTLVDMAIYPVLFASYLSFAIPLGAPAQIAIGVALVWLAGGLNLMGIRPVGGASIGLAVVLIAPFAALVIAGMPRLIHWTAPLQPMFGRDALGALGGGLSIVIWNYSGWENLSVVAGEIKNPRHNYLRAIAIALPLVALGYLMPLGVALTGATSTAAWQAGYFVEVGKRIGGPLLGLALAIGGAISAFSIFEAAMLWVSRMPYVLAREGYLPAALGQLRAGRGIPARSIVVCCMLFSFLVPMGFIALVLLDVFFYMGALALELWALIRLRRIYPDRSGLFVIPGGRAALITVAMAPMATWIATFGLAVSHNASGRRDLIVAIVLGVCVWPAYAIARRRFGGPPPA
ncbi:MAG: APC family permease [Candidatus Binataceae bacterium]|nr:APC family permease [Candidatus Binataceae bacterium]